MVTSLSSETLEGRAFMKSVGVAELKASLSKYLSMVKDGEEVLITDRGKPVARIVPSVPTDDMPAHLRELARQGRVRLPKVRPTKEFWDELLRMPRPSDPEGLVLKALLEEREE